MNTTTTPEIGEHLPSEDVCPVHRITFHKPLGACPDCKDDAR